MLCSRKYWAFLVIGVVLSSVGFGQDREKIKQLTPSLHGSTGLFNLYLADTLRQGEFTIGLHATKFNREPGDLDFTIFPVSFTLGLHDRLELFGSYEVHKRTHADAILVNKIAPGGPIVPARIATGQVAFFNDAPFLDVGFGDGAGDLWAGLKINLLSERRGEPIGLAVQPIARFHLTDKREHLARGLTTGATDAGFDFILSKDLAGGGYFTGNAGLLFAQDRLNVDRQNLFRYGVGFDVPMGTPSAHFIAELVGTHFYGSKATSELTNPTAPLDLYAGLRVFPARWVALSGAYNFNLKTNDDLGIPSTDRHGFYAQLLFQRKVNRPPTIECTAERATVTEGDSVTVRAIVTDPDDDVLTISWRAPAGGTVTQRNGEAVFNSSGLTPGRYTVIGEVTDGEHVATCSVDITVEKRMLAPTVTCEPAAVSVTIPDSVTLVAPASDPNNDPLTQTWTVNDETVVSDQPVVDGRAQFVFGSEGRTPGTYRVRVTVTDVDNMSANCEFTVTVLERPNRPPVVTLTLNPTEVFAGEIVTATADAHDPDDDPLTFSWRVGEQARPETTAQIQINTAGFAGGTHSVTVTVDDGRGGVASDTKSFSVREKITCQMDRAVPDNICKAQLDEVALKLQQQPALRALVTGHTDSTGTAEGNVRMGQRRADGVKDYLVTQHQIDPARIETRSAGQDQPIADNDTAEGRKQNRRAEIELYVP